jgi:hypothetical protein
LIETSGSNKQHDDAVSSSVSLCCSLKEFGQIRN